MSDDSDNYEFSDAEIDDKKYEKIVDDVLNLNKVQHVKKASRTEPTTHVSEFNLVKSLSGNKGSVQLTELANVLKTRKKHADISKKLQSTSSKSKTLPTPLGKPQSERIRRSLNYEKSRLELDRWEAFVTSNRAASQVTFPLDSVDKVKFEEKKAEVYPSTFRIKSDLQKELEKLDPKVEEYHIESKDENEYPLTLEELKQKRKEAAKLRAHQSFKEAKARRQNKIKSKKYHRILRREKIKQKLKEFEELQKTNPEEAIKRLEDIEKARAEERFSLRHKSTGQWARSKQVRAKYDKESRQVLAQQLAISRELTQKPKSVESESDDENAGEQETQSKVAKNDENNPWINGVKVDKEVVDFVSGYRKYWNEKNKGECYEISDDKGNAETQNESMPCNSPSNEVESTKSLEKNEAISKNLQVKKVKNKSVTKITKQKENKLSLLVVKKVKTKRRSSQGTSDWDVEDIFDNLEHKLVKKIKKQLKAKEKKPKKNQEKVKKEVKKIDLSMPSQSKKPFIDEAMIEEPTGEEAENVGSNLSKLKQYLNAPAEKEVSTDINPEKFIKPKGPTNLNVALPDIVTTDENEEDTSQRDIIMEAFEDDDIAADFEKDKNEEIKKDTPKDIDLNLPGWGSWAGGNIDPNKRKRKRFIIKMPAKLPRRDDNKGSLIINERAQAKIKPHLVSEVPFPFKTVKDYEASIRAPIGNTFVPETAFRKLIQPAVKTKMGAIIEPISKSMLIGKKRS